MFIQNTIYHLTCFRYPGGWINRTSSSATYSLGVNATLWKGSFGIATVAAAGTASTSVLCCCSATLKALHDGFYLNKSGHAGSLTLEACLVYDEK